jgi:mannose-1-phosphate guanylyltransferase
MSKLVSRIGMQLQNDVPGEPPLDPQPTDSSGPHPLAADQPPRIVPVILSGGGGTRLWPVSTNETPKQFLPLLAGGKSLFQQALERVRDRSRFHAPIVVASARHAGICEHELAGEGADARLILEPVARNTAPAILMATFAATEMHGGDSLLLVMPSDHVIERPGEFHDAVACGVCAATAGNLVTFGIRPDSPNTGFGYIKMGSESPRCSGVRTVSEFIEKPSLEVAQQLIANGDCVWNAGIFLFRASSILEEAEKLAPGIADPARAAYANAARDGIRMTPDAQLFSDCPSESIDYAIMEHSTAVAVTPLSAGWSDVGSWDALADLPGDERSSRRITALDCENCYMFSDGIPVAAVGVRDLIIVASPAGVLVVPRGQSQEVKKLLAAMGSTAP